MNLRLPIFFNRVEKITVQDRLSNFLGTFENGLIEFTYPDVVKSAGQSSPTVAGHYLICLKALNKTDIPHRGSIKVMFKESGMEGWPGLWP